MDMLGTGAEHRRNNFDAMRLIFAVAVIFSHSYALTGVEQREPIIRLTHDLSSAGTMAVAGFFIISGFLITRSWLREPQLLPYLRKRALRILPGYWAAMLVSIFLVAPWVSTGAIHVVHMLAQGFRLEVMESANVFATNPHAGLNGSLWTIRYEFYCYLFLALLGMIGLLRMRGAFALLAVASLLLIAAQQHWLFLGYHEVPGLGMPGVWPLFLGCFATGMAFFAYRGRVPYSFPAFVVALVLLAAALALHKGTITLTLLPPLYGYVIFYIAFSPRVPLHNVGRWGDFSYGTYLYAWPIQQLLVWRFHGIGPMELFLAATPLALLAALASWRWVEGPSMELKRRTNTDAAPQGGRVPLPAAAPSSVSA